jgi:outer membrane protein assembly factor BamB
LCSFSDFWTKSQRGMLRNSSACESRNNNTQLIALNQATGATVWGRIEITGSASTTYDGGKVFVVSATVGGQGTVQSYDIETGKLDWTVTLTGGIIGGA